MEGEFIRFNRSEKSNSHSRHRGVTRHNKTRPEVFVIDCDNGEIYDDEYSLKTQTHYSRTGISTRNLENDRRGISDLFYAR